MTAAPVYLDHHATTPVDPRVAKVVLDAMTTTFGNANSVQHAFGRAAARLVREAADSVAALLHCDADDIRFTSSATAALRLALAYAVERRPAAPLRVAASSIEHPALLEELERGARQGWLAVRWVPVDIQGVLDLPAMEAALADGADLVCLMAANNEVGAIQPVEAVAALAAGAGAEILVDASQAAGRIPLHIGSWGIDYLVISGHKLYGPKGVGALVGPELADAPPPARYAGHQATPNVPGIAGLGEACRICRSEMAVDEARIGTLRDRLQARLLKELPGAVVNGPSDRRLAANLHLSIPNVPNDAIVAQLANSVAVSTGAACVSGVDAPSHVLRAMALPAWRQDGALRISLGRFTTMEDIDRAAGSILAAVRAVRALVRTS
jgi:cysteine desulfurase